MMSLTFCVLIFVFTKLYKSDIEDESYTDNRINCIEKPSTVQDPDETWTSAALKEIAYYLRNYKFNEWDQRYYQEKPSDNLVGFYKAFPSPNLRTLHWKVHENCHENFYKCIFYLHSVIQTAPFTRSDDIITILNKKCIDNETIIKTLDTQCKESKQNCERSCLPFDSPREKFQWRTTASYYMCWYTMMGTLLLSMLGDACDNYANCLDPEFGYRNRDPRSDDRMSFACATYSFCPDPCCPLKNIRDLNQCHEAINNPCYNSRTKETNKLNKQCILDRKENNNLEGIISNKWNVSCRCKENGYIWKSQFGMCVDLNECLSGLQMCDDQTEDCLNTPGSYKCICKLNYKIDEKSRKCIKSDDFIFNEDYFY